MICKFFFFLSAFVQFKPKKLGYMETVNFHLCLVFGEWILSLIECALGLFLHVGMMYLLMVQ